MKNGLPEKKDYPEGYRLVTTGRVKTYDKIWNALAHRWENVTVERGRAVSSYFCVVRKNEPPVISLITITTDNEEDRIVLKKALKILNEAGLTICKKSDNVVLN